jgi:uncharacterized protein (DUF302 family)
VLGIVVNLLSAWGHLRLAHKLDEGGSVMHGPSTLAVAVAVVLAVLGLAMGIYVVSVNGSHSQPRTDKEEFMAPGMETGMVTIPSRHSVDETVANVEKVLAAKGVKLFAVIDHSGEAEKAGLRMPSTKLLIFGNPKVGTPLMLAAPSIAIDLPLKILVAEGPDGRVSISYNAPEYIQARHHLPEELARAYANAGVDVLAGKAAE